MYAKYEVFISYGSDVIANVKVDNRQTDKHTGQKQYAPIIPSRGLKLYCGYKYTRPCMINRIWYLKQL